MSDPENFLDALVAPQAAKPPTRMRSRTSRRPRRRHSAGASRTPTDRCRASPRQRPPRRPEFDLAKLPSIEFDRRQYRHPRLSAARACRRSSSVRRFVAPGRPIRPFAISLGWRRTTGTSTTRRRCPGSGHWPADFDVKKMVAQLFGEAPQDDPPNLRNRIGSRSIDGKPQHDAVDAETPVEAADRRRHKSGDRLHRTSSQAACARATDNLVQREENIATQNKDTEDQARRRQRRAAHTVERCRNNNLMLIASGY